MMLRKKKKKKNKKKPFLLPSLHLSPSLKSLSSSSNTITTTKQSPLQQQQQPSSSSPSPSPSTPTKKKKLLQVILNTPNPNPNLPSPNPNFPNPNPNPNSTSWSASSPSSSSSSSFPASPPPAPPPPLPPPHLHPHHSQHHQHHQQQLLLQQQKQEILHQQTQKLTSELHFKLQQQHLHHLQLQQHHPELLQHLKHHIYPHPNTDLRHEEQGLRNPNLNYVSNSSLSPNSNSNSNPNPKRSRVVFQDHNPSTNGENKLDPLPAEGKFLRNSAIETPPPKAMDSSETSVVPTKKALRGVLEELQKKDKFGVFSEPVDAKEVPEYYNIIKEPMDFGTMKKRIGAGYYINLELFEKDVFKICSNAMTFNAMGTVYYKQARAIKIAAERCFGEMRIKYSSSMNLGGEVVARQKSTVKRSHKKKVTLKTLGDNPNMEYASEAMLSNGDYDMDSQDGHAFAQAKANGDHNKEHPSPSYFAKSGEGRRSLSTDESRRNTFKPLSVRGGAATATALVTPSLQFVPAACQFQFSYARSLAWFAADLGPDVWKVAEDKIRRALPPGVPFGPGWVGERASSGTALSKMNIALHSKHGDTSTHTKSTHLHEDRGVRNGSMGGYSNAKEMVSVSVSHLTKGGDVNSDCPIQPKDSASDSQVCQDAISNRRIQPAVDGIDRAEMRPHPVSQLSSLGSSERLLSEKGSGHESTAMVGNIIVKSSTKGLLLCTDVNPKHRNSSSFVETQAVVPDTKTDDKIQDNTKEGDKKPLQNGKVGGTIHT